MLENYEGKTSEQVHVTAFFRMCRQEIWSIYSGLPFVFLLLPLDRLADLLAVQARKPVSARPGGFRTSKYSSYKLFVSKQNVECVCTPVYPQIIYCTAHNGLNIIP